MMSVHETGTSRARVMQRLSDSPFRSAGLPDQHVGPIHRAAIVTPSSAAKTSVSGATPWGRDRRPLGQPPTPPPSTSAQSGFPGLAFAPPRPGQDIVAAISRAGRHLSQFRRRWRDTRRTSVVWGGEGRESRLGHPDRPQAIAEVLADLHPRDLAFAVELKDNQLA